MSVVQIEVRCQDVVQFLQYSLPSNIRQSVQNAMALVADRILETAQMFTPVRTGFLLSTEGLESEGEWAFVIYARAFYAPFVEWGTRRMCPRLFMTRAFELHKDELPMEIDNALYSVLY